MADKKFDVKSFSIHNPHSCVGPTEPAEIAAVLRVSVRELRELQQKHGPDCKGHPVTLGHMLALRIADLLDPAGAV